ncbi:MAG: NUDIX hydrolase [Candidatus Pacebacteria bacterium]|jgi:8-oxo-dGTP diphosphatase|nr:NUDIX hydrolase [Candidatus Paceibacterota bacterium]MBT4651848.1 NUDIX hydrolase [Candidatus Paceibacterota bacterium]MBT6755654.1 NUDIX hydrolase [Candidatus Paceibacterota bacterium]MBT6921803.1 NUDIX hydrolase [Candidatus Paceibacterota bacterium]
MTYHWPSNFWQQWLANAPVLCVDAVLVSKEKVLLSRRRTEPFKGYWHLPGGIVRKDETLEEALKRIVSIEIGLEDISIDKQIGIFDNPKRDPRGHFITVAFLISSNKLPKQINSQGEELKFFEKLPVKTGFDVDKITKEIFK